MEPVGDEYPAWYIAALQQSSAEPEYNPDADIRPRRQLAQQAASQATGQHVWWMVILGAVLQAIGMLMVLIGELGHQLVKGGQSLTNHLTDAK